MSDQGNRNPEELKKKYRPLVIQQLQKGGLPQMIKPKLLQIGLSEQDATELINDAIAAAAPTLGPKSVVVRQAAGQPVAPEKKPLAPKSIEVSDAQRQKIEQRKEVQKKLVDAGFNPYEAEKMAHTQVTHAEFEQTRQKLVDAGFSAEEAEMAKSKTTSLLSPDAFAMTPRPKEIDANTNYAGFLDRVVAMLIDGLVLLIPMGFIQVLFFIIPSLQKNPGFGTGLLIIFGSFLQIALQWYYFASQESGLKMGTIGKAKMGIIVTDESGYQISFARASARFFSKWISAMTLMIGYLMPIFTPQKRALHDYIAGTLVIKQ